MGSSTSPIALSSTSGSRRRFLQLGLGAAGAATLGLTGCSNFTNSDPAPGTSGATGGPFDFTFWGTGAEKAAVTKVVDAFGSARGMTVKAQSIPDAYETKLNTLLAAGNPPDAGYLTEAMAMRLGEQGKIVSVAGQPGFEDYLPSAIHYWAPGKAVSQAAVEATALWFDQDVTTQAGVIPPATSDSAWTIDALVEAADALTADDNGRRPSESGFDPEQVARYGVAAPVSLPGLVALFKSNGVDLFDEGGTKTNLDSPEAIAVLQQLSDLIFVHRVAPTQAQATTFGASTALLLASKRVAMAVDGQWALLDLAPSKVNYDVGVMPRFQTAVTTVISGGIGIFEGTPYRDQAMELLLELGDPSKSDLYSSGLWMPLSRKYYTDEALIKSWIDNDVHPAGYRTAVLEPTLNNPVSYPSYKIKNFSIIQTTLANGINPMFTKQTDIPAAAARLASSVNKLMQGAYPDTAA